MRELGRQFGAEVTDDDAARLAGSVPDWPAFPDSPPALAALSTRYQLIILSNVDRDSFAASNRRLGVTFTSVLTAQDIGSYKPSPAQLRCAAGRSGPAGYRRGRLLHVAQSLFHDHVPAKRAGLRTVWINRRHDRLGWGATPAPPADVVPDWEFPSLQALADAVAADAARLTAVNDHAVSTHQPRSGASRCARCASYSSPVTSLLRCAGARRYGILPRCHARTR